MADNRVRVQRVRRCDVGKLGSNQVALKISFAVSGTDGKEGAHQDAVFGLSRELARGLAKALTSVLEETTTSSQTRSTQN